MDTNAMPDELTMHRAANKSGTIKGDVMPIVMGVIMAVLLCSTAVCRADEAADKAREEAQRALNAAVMATPFNPGDIKKAESYAEQSKKDNVTPAPQPPSYWLPGWTCANLAGYAYYNYGDYQNCVYYHYYYGPYWR